MSANIFRSVLRALLRKQTYQSVRANAEDAFGEATVRLLFEQTSHLHDRIPDRDLACEDLRGAIEVTFSGDLQRDLLAYVEAMGEVAPADDAIVRELLARQMLDRANEKIVQGRLAGKLDIAGPESFIQRARDVYEGGRAAGAVSLDAFGLPSAGTDRGRVSTTGVGGLDRALSGGTGTGEMLVIAARPKLGKTSTMVAFGAAKLKAGKNVLWISGEVRGGKIARLFERAAVHKRKDDWTDADTVHGREIYSKAGGRLWIKDLSHSQITPGIIEACIRSVQNSEQVVLDCVIIDYLQLLRLPGKSGRDKRFEYSEIAQEIRAIGNRLDVDVISGWQINREGATKDTARETDLSECWDIFMHVDTLIILNQTSAEKANRTMRLTIAAQREDPDAARTVTAHCDWGIMVLQDNIQEVRDSVRKAGGTEGSERRGGPVPDESGGAGLRPVASVPELHHQEGTQV